MFLKTAVTIHDSANSLIYHFPITPNFANPHPPKIAQSSHAEVIKQKCPSESFQAKVPKRTIPSEQFQTNSPKGD